MRIMHGSLQPGGPARLTLLPSWPAQRVTKHARHCATKMSSASGLLGAQQMRPAGEVHCRALFR